MAQARGRNEQDQPRRLPRGRHALAPEQVLADQRRRLVEAVPRVVATHGYAAMSVAHIVQAAAVSRNAFYDNFADKRECFAAAHEACQERLLATVEQRCRKGASSEERVETTLGAALVMLSSTPEVARLIFVEAPGAGGEVSLRYHAWLRRYGTLLRAAASPAAPGAGPPGEIDQVIVGGIASRIASEVVEGRLGQLRTLTPHFVDYVLAFYGPGRSKSDEADLAAHDPETPPEYPEAQRRRAGA
jgi:AcrR family transcriptional regulator